MSGIKVSGAAHSYLYPNAGLSSYFVDLPDLTPGPGSLQFKNLKARFTMQVKIDAKDKQEKEYCFCHDPEIFVGAGSAPPP